MKKFYQLRFQSNFLLLFFFTCVTGVKAQNIYLVDAAHTGMATATPVTTVTVAAWNNATGNLQAALNAAASGSGGQIWVKADFYYPSEYPGVCNNCTGDRDKAFLLQNDVAVYGGFAGTETLLSQRNISANLTILSGDIGVLNDNSDNSYHILLTVNSNSTAILDGFTITGGNANGAGFISVMGQNSSRNSGGGILNDSFSHPTISNCTFTNNSGGAMSNIYYCLPSIINCKFINNDGAAMFNESFSHATVTNCTFVSNSGTGMYNHLSGPNVTYCLFAGNNRGMNNEISNPNISNCSFENNSGGGITNGDFTQPLITKCSFTGSNMTNSSYSSARVISCTFTNNSRGMNNVRASPSIINCIFTNNSNGVYNIATASPTITNCTFANNSTYGIYNEYQCRPRITNCIIWGNGASNAAPGIYNFFGTEPTVTYSLVQGGYAGTGNVNSDPLYINAGAAITANGVVVMADSGLQLQPCSPAINKGYNTAISGITTDFAGATRIQGGIVDMGAYEYQGSPTAISLSTNTDKAVFALNTGITTHFITNCHLIASLLPTGASPVNGNVSASVWIDTSQVNYNGQTYVKRHYEIIPAANPGTTTARVTLYATQTEFNNFNNYGTNFKLPTDPTDAAGIASLRIIQFNSPGNGSGMPSGYAQPGIEVNPTDNNIIWNNTLQYWEITFEVTGFGGFFIGDAGSSILPLTLLNFGARALTASSAMLKWHTVSEMNTSCFEAQRSMDGYHFTTIAKVQARGIAGSKAKYNYTDPDLKAGFYYYRLRVVYKDGKEKYSVVVVLQFKAQNTISLYPVPAKEVVWLRGGAAHLIGRSALLMDMQGRILQSVRINQWPQSIDISALAAGNYLIKLPDETTVKLIKQ